MVIAYLAEHALTKDDIDWLEIPLPRMNAALERGLPDAIATVEHCAILGYPI
uniref:Uncharacterized protein n=1 Tax=Candidatus Kentrum sp. TC TaxID=2126339 RepID=A0A450Y8F2_9GAMM|nr:MAG: hypothetical protein BECKTC1821D_GA0114238_100265 [Candidatus Kentron sp. TC]